MEIMGKRLKKAKVMEWLEISAKKEGGTQGDVVQLKLSD